MVTVEQGTALNTDTSWTPCGPTSRARLCLRNLQRREQHAITWRYKSCLKLARSAPGDFVLRRSSRQTLTGLSLSPHPRTSAPVHGPSLEPPLSHVRLQEGLRLRLPRGALRAHRDCGPVPRHFQVRDPPRSRGRGLQDRDLPPRLDLRGYSRFTLFPCLSLTTFTPTDLRGGY